MATTPPHPHNKNVLSTLFSIHFSQFKILLASLNKSKSNKCLLQIIKILSTSIISIHCIYALYLESHELCLLFLGNHGLTLIWITITKINSKKAKSILSTLKTKYLWRQYINRNLFHEQLVAIYEIKMCFQS